MQTGSHRVAGLIFHLGKSEQVAALSCPQRNSINVQF